MPFRAGENVFLVVSKESFEEIGVVLPHWNSFDLLTILGRSMMGIAGKYQGLFFTATRQSNFSEASIQQINKDYSQSTGSNHN